MEVRSQLTPVTTMISVPASGQKTVPPCLNFSQNDAPGMVSCYAQFKFRVQVHRSNGNCMTEDSEETRLNEGLCENNSKNYFNRGRFVRQLYSTVPLRNHSRLLTGAHESRRSSAPEVQQHAVR